MKQTESINARQIKAARVLLGWSQTDFSKVTGISIATIRRLEAGYISPRSKTTNTICLCFESAGIEFLESDGVRRRPGSFSLFEGNQGGEDFLEDIKNTIQRNGGNVLIVTPTAEAFARYCGLEDILDLSALTDFGKTISIKCLITDEVEAPMSTPRFQFRTLSRAFIDPVPFCTYGEKYGIAVPNGKPFCKLVIIDAPRMAVAARQHFLSLWNKGAQTVMAKENVSRVA